MRVGAAQRNQYRAALTVQNADLATELGIGQVVRLEGWDTHALHKGYGHYVIFGRDVGQVHIGELALLITVTGAGGPVVPKTHHDFFIGHIRHGGCVICSLCIDNVIGAHSNLVILGRINSTRRQ
ncbi:hypothetical protein D3C72_1784260 [compost metagenome]